MLKHFHLKDEFNLSYVIFFCNMKRLCVLFNVNQTFKMSFSQKDSRKSNGHRKYYQTQTIPTLGIRVDKKKIYITIHTKKKPI